MSEFFGSVEKSPMVHDLDDPSRCTNRTFGKQCHRAKLPGEEVCSLHSRGAKANKASKYRLAKVSGRFEDFRNNPDKKSLYDEIAILRLTLENVINTCNDENALFARASQIAMAVDKIDKLVRSQLHIEQKLGALITKDEALAFASGVIDIIASEVKDDDVCETISTKITDLFLTTKVMAAVTVEDG